MNNKTHENLVKLVFLALLTSIVIIFQLMGNFINLSIAAISLVLVPVVLGAVMLGSLAGCFLGLVAGAVMLISGGANAFFVLSPFGTSVIVLLKGGLCGLCAGLVYKLAKNWNKIFASFLAAIVCPVVNTAIYVIGCLTVFKPFLASNFGFKGGNVFVFVLFVMVGLNFPFELLLNVVLSPAIIRLSDIGVKYFGKKKKK